MPERLLIALTEYNRGVPEIAISKNIECGDFTLEAEALLITNGGLTVDMKAAGPGNSNLTVMKNPQRQDHGSCRKIAFQYAIEKKFDLLVVFDSEKQPVSEQIAALVEPVLSGKAGVCIGCAKEDTGDDSVMLPAGFSGVKQAAFHPGLRAYRVGGLADLPFRYNTDGPGFDVEIILQFMEKGAAIAIAGVPGYSDAEPGLGGRLQGLGMALGSLVLNRLQSMGVFYHPKFDVLGDEPDYSIKLGYRSSHSLAIDAVKHGATVLDLACGPGYVADELATKKDCRVTGIDVRETSNPSFTEFLRHNLNELELPERIGTYDYIMALDCIEHLDRPGRFLALLRSSCYSPRTLVIITAPNVGFFITRMSLLFGHFNYGKQGILDFTHKRLFTFKSLRRTVEREGYKIDRIRGIPAPFPKAFGNKSIGKFLCNVNQLLIYLWKSVFSYQIYIEARFMPPTSELIAEASAPSSANEAQPQTQDAGKF